MTPRRFPRKYSHRRILSSSHWSSRHTHPNDQSSKHGVRVYRPLRAQRDVKHVLVDGNLAAVHYQDYLTAQNPGAAVPGIFRLQDDKIAEHWDAFQPI